MAPGFTGRKFNLNNGRLKISYHNYRERTYIIVPVFNEDEMINTVVKDLEGLGCHLIVVDDGSLKPVSQSLQAVERLTCIRHKVNLGQGAAIQTGMDFALAKGATLFVTFDADGQHRAEDIPSLLIPLISGDADIVLASRFLSGQSHKVPLVKRMLLRTGRYVNYAFTGLYLTDAHNGLRALNRTAALTIRINENRMAHATEILDQVKKHRLRYKEIGATVIYTAYSRGKGQSYWNSIKIFFDLLLQKLFG
jgi:glycosyltransferase involved in cell wall biosynthesis